MGIDRRSIELMPVKILFYDDFEAIDGHSGALRSIVDKHLWFPNNVLYWFKLFLRRSLCMEYTTRNRYTVTPPVE